MPPYVDNNGKIKRDFAYKIIEITYNLYDIIVKTNVYSHTCKKKGRLTRIGRVGAFESLISNCKYYSITAGNDKTISWGSRAAFCSLSASPNLFDYR